MSGKNYEKNGSVQRTMLEKKLKQVQRFLAIESPVVC